MYNRHLTPNIGMRISTENLNPSLAIMSTGRPLVTIAPDGTLTFGEGYTPDEAARVFWDAMSFQAKTIANQLATARERLRKLEMAPIGELEPVTKHVHYIRFDDEDQANQHIAEQLASRRTRVRLVPVD